MHFSIGMTLFSPTSLGDEGQSQTGVAAEPELQGNVQDLTSNSSGVGSGSGEAGHVADHVGIAKLVASGLGQLVPDVQPVTVVLVNALATNLDLSILDQNVAEPVEPAEILVVISSDGGQLHAEVHAADQITVAGHGAGDLLAPVSSTVEGLLDGLHTKVSMATVDHLEEGDLRVTG